MTAHVRNVGQKDVWNLQLNKYQRDNLLFALNVIGCSGTQDKSIATKPFTILNTGDWACELASMLGKLIGWHDGKEEWTYTIDKDDQPNSTVESLETQVRQEYGIRQDQHAFIECYEHVDKCWRCGVTYEDHRSGVRMPASAACYHTLEKSDD